MAELLGGRTVLALPAPSEPLPFEVEPPARAKPKAPRASLPGDLPCPHCDRTDFRTQVALNIHIGRAHQSEKPPAARKAPRKPADPATPARDDPNWRCAGCSKRPGQDGAFARSIRHPNYCMHCARSLPTFSSAAAA